MGEAACLKAFSPERGGGAAPQFDPAASLRKSRVDLNQQTLAAQFRTGQPLAQFYTPRKSHPEPLLPEQLQLLEQIWKEDVIPLLSPEDDGRITRPGELIPLVTKFIKLSRYFTTPVWKSITGALAIKEISIEEFRNWCGEHVGRGDG